MGRLTRLGATMTLVAGLTLVPIGGAVGVHLHDMDVLDFRFSNPTDDSTTIHVRPGTEVTWTHGGTAAHTVTSSAGSGETFDSHPACAPGPTCMTTGQSFGHTFNSTGSFDYFCKVHPSMTGTVVVTDTPPEANFTTTARSVIEGDSGTSPVPNVTIELAYDWDVDITIDVFVGPSGASPAAAGDDYVEPDGGVISVVIPAGTTRKTVAGLAVRGDTEEEPTETFALDLGGTTPIGDDSTLTVSILDDDGASPTFTPPVADAGGPYEAVEGEDLTLDGSASTDADGTVVGHSWDTDGDGTVDADGATVVVSYPDEADGPVTVTLIVEDDDGLTDSVDVEVTVVDGATVTRSADEDRVLTAVKVAADHWTRSEHAVLATAFNFPDALAATPLAASLDAPLLLTPVAELPREVEDRLDALAVRTVWLLGGTSAISQAVEDRLRLLGYEIRRLAGEDRFETAAAVALEVGASPTEEVIVTLGQHRDPARDSWPDALSAGSLSGGPDLLPTLLGRTDTLPDATIEALDALAPRKVWLVGGEAAISADVAAQLEAFGYDVARLSGDSRYGTTVAVAAEAMSRLPAGDVPVVFATGGNFPDGLTAGALAAHLGGVVALVHPSDLGAGAPDVVTFLEADAGRFDDGVVVGGTTAVAPDVATALAAAMRA